MPQKDTYGRHECLDRTGIIMSLVDRELLEHSGLEKDEAQLVQKVLDTLFELYQLLGERNLEEEPQS